MLFDTDKPERIRHTRNEIDRASESGIDLKGVTTKQQYSGRLISWIKGMSKSNPDALEKLAKKLTPTHEPK